MAKEIKHFALRIDDKGIFKDLEKEAKQKRLSVNSLINNVLDENRKKFKNSLVKVA